MRLRSVFLLFISTFICNSILAQYKLDTALMGANKVQFISSTEGFAYPDLFCMTPTDAIYHTTDAGHTWRTMATNFKENAGDYPFTQNIFFLDSMTAWMVNADGSRSYLYKTTDGGVTWIQKTASTGDTTNVPTSKTYYNVHFVDANNGWLVGDQIIMHTTDGGNTWTQQFFLDWVPTYACVLQAIYSFNSNNAYVVGNGGLILHTLDGGTHWAIQNIDTNTIAFGEIADQNCYSIFDVKFTDSLHGYASCWLGGYLTTSDAGTHWAKLNTGHSFDNLGVDATDSNNLWLSGGPFCNNTGCFTFSTIFHSKNAGVTWDTILYRPEVYNPSTGGFTRIKFISPSLGYSGNSHGFVLRIKDTTAVAGIQDLSQNGDFISIYPNPANDVVTITCSQPVVAPGTVTIYNSAGEEVLSEQFTASGKLISVGSLSAGIYLCKVCVNGHTQINKLLVTR